MAYHISDLDGTVVAPGGSYPYGNVKNAPSGTRVNVKMVTDYLQFFQKIMSLAGITVNGNPDNSANGYQYVQALNKLINQEPGGMAAAFGAGGFVAIKMSGMVASGSGPTTVTAGWFFYNGQYVYFPAGTYGAIPVGEVVLITISTTDGLPTATVGTGTTVTDATHFPFANMVTFATAVGITSLQSAVSTNTTNIGTNTGDIITLFAAIADTNTIPAWTNATYAATWSAGGSPAKYTKDSAGRVYMQGFAVTTGTPGAATVLTLPSGYRPLIAINLLCPSVISLTSTPAYISISTAGVVTLQNFGTFLIGSALYFDGVMFLTI